MLRDTATAKMSCRHRGVSNRAGGVNASSEAAHVVLEGVLRSDAVDLLYGVRGRVQARRLAVVDPLQLEILLVSWRTGRGLSPQRSSLIENPPLI